MSWLGRALVVRCNAHITLVCELDGVADQIGDDLAQTGWVSRQMFRLRRIDLITQLQLRAPAHAGYAAQSHAAGVRGDSGQRIQAVPGWLQVGRTPGCR